MNETFLFLLGKLRIYYFLLDYANGWSGRWLPDQVPRADRSSEQKSKTETGVRQFTQRPGNELFKIIAINNVQN